MTARNKKAEQDSVVELSEIFTAVEEAPTEPAETELERVKRENAELAEALKEQERLRAALANATSPVEAPADVEEGTIHLHFLVDGFTACGVTYYRGQELQFDVPSRAYDQQKDRFGNTWLSLVDDPRGQIKKFGQQYFASGPWPYIQWGDDGIATTSEEREDIRRAGAAESKRSIKAPEISGE